MDPQAQPEFMPPVQQPKRSSNLGIPVAIVIAGLIIAGAVYLRGSPSTTTATNNGAFKALNTKITYRPVDATDHILGNPAATLVLIEYSDTECPFCKRFHATMHQIMNDYGKDGKVAWVYRQMPLEQLHSRAPKESEATECVAELGGNDKFWQYLDSLYEVTNSNDSLDPAQLPLLASKIGIDVKAFNTCLSSGKHTKKVTDSINEGSIAAGTQATPFSIIVDKKGNTYPIDGAFPYATLKPIIDGLLKGK